LTVIGDVASLRDHIGWFERRPLFGKTVLVTRAAHQASALSGLLRGEGARVIELPALAVTPVENRSEINAAIDRLRTRGYNWCPFTSANAVDFLFDALAGAGLDARIFGPCFVAAIGPATAAALLRHGIHADVVAEEETSEGLAAGLENVRGHVLLPRARDTRPVLAEALRARGADVDDVILYETKPPAEVDPDALTALRSGKVDAVTFASSSAVRNLAKILGPDFDRVRAAPIACIGPITAETAREMGLNVAVVPERHTVPAMVQALRDYLTSHST
jgi:uroporphyrinogen III methyltransferase/synthase